MKISLTSSCLSYNYRIDNEFLVAIPWFHPAAFLFLGQNIINVEVPLDLSIDSGEYEFVEADRLVSVRSCTVYFLGTVRDG